MKGGDMGGEGNTHGRNQKFIQNFIAYMDRKYLLEDLNAVGNNIYLDHK
jgi:hypothetical protein